MKLTKLFVGAFALSAMLVACGDDSTSAKDTDQPDVVYSDVVVETFDNLPVCSDNRDGSIAYVKDEKTVYICTDGSWVPEEETSSSSENISAGSVYDATAKTLTDWRDGRTYKTVVIGEQTWMADNLNYETENSYCNDDDPSNCSKYYGRLYTWVAATTVCPSGWHLPSTTEWNTLFTAVGGISTAGAKLKSQTGWAAYDGITNEDSFGFSALPAGLRYYDGFYYGEGPYAYFWSSSENNSSSAYSMYLYYDYDNAYLDINPKYFGLSVRCVKD